MHLIFIFRYVYQQAKPLLRYGACMPDFVIKLNKVLLPLIASKIGGSAHTQGMGRHDK